MTDGYSLLKAVNHFKIKDKANIVVNKVLEIEEGEKTFLKFKAAVNKFLTLDVNFLGYIYEDKKLVLSVRKQTPFVIEYPNCEASICIDNISNKILKIDYKLNIGVKGLFKKLFSIFS